jgi:hypothetical protein
MVNTGVDALVGVVADAVTFVGPVVSTLITWDRLAVLPTVSETSTVNVYVPSANAEGGVYEKLFPF